MALGGGLRLWQIGAQPGGFYHDEAFYALDAVSVLQGRLALFFAANNGREPLFIYLLAPMIAVLGRTVLAARGTSALIGIATLPAIYLAGRALFGRRVGLLSAAILAGTFWHLALSRLALRAITLPLILCLAVGLTVQAFAPASGEPAVHPRWRAILAGFVTGLVWYTYTSAQMQLLFVPVMALTLWLSRPMPGRGSDRAVWFGWLLGLALALAPLAFWLTRHADLYLARAGQVSVLSPTINQGDLSGTVFGNIGKALGMFIITGDRIWRHNLSLRPVFDSITGPVFLIGAGACIWWLIAARKIGPPRRAPAVILLAWLLIYLLPTILAEDTPHFLRAVGALPAACILAGVGLEVALAWVSRRGLLMMLAPFRRWIEPPALVAIALLALSGYQTAHDYFDTYVRLPIVGYWLEDQSVSLAQTINDARPGVAQPPSQSQFNMRFLDAASFQSERTALAYLAADRLGDWHSFDQSAPLPPGLTSAQFILDPNRDWSAIRQSLPLSPSVLGLAVPARAQNDLDARPRDAYLVLSVTPLISKTGGAPVPTAGFANGMQLVGWQLEPYAQPTQVHLYWRLPGPVPDDIAVFAHWQAGSGLIAQDDKTPTDNLLPPAGWRANQLIEDTLTVPDDKTSATQIQVGLYRRGDNTRVAVLDDSGAALGDSVIIWRR